MPESKPFCGQSQVLNGDDKERKRAELEEYVHRMAYRVTTPVYAKPDLSRLAQSNANAYAFCFTYEQFRKFLGPEERQKCVRDLAKRHCSSTPVEQIEILLRDAKNKEQREQAIRSRIKNLYQEMLQKYEKRIRIQFLNAIIKKFATFIAKLATSIVIPPSLNMPMARMQHSIFCKILSGIGINPTCPQVMDYMTPEAQEFEVCYKLAHALVCLIIKEIDSAASKAPCIARLPNETNVQVDRYLKDRFMCAAKKKVARIERQKKCITTPPLDDVLKKCEQWNQNC